MSVRIISWNVNGFHSTGTRGPRKMVLRQELQPALVGRVDGITVIDDGDRMWVVMGIDSLGVPKLVVGGSLDETALAMCL